MSMAAPARRLLPRRLFSHTLPIRSRRTVAPQQWRAASNDSSGSNPSSPSNPILAEYLRKNPPAAPKDREEERQEQMREQRKNLDTGDIAPSSIFEVEQQAQKLSDRSAAQSSGRPTPKLANALQRKLDPNPSGRLRWERKKVIQMVRRGGRVNRSLLISRTERSLDVRSHNLKTSVKKLGMIARQIAGKTVEDALVQLRFSKKKVAREVYDQLERARDEAIVKSGMGIDKVDPETSKPVDIQLKDGTRYTVKEPAKIYIDQAWVGRGPYGQLPDFRARGQTYIMRTPWTSISFKLKEEKTRVREWKEREEKRRRRREKKVWVPLPDRPITTKQAWYSW